MNVKTNLNYWNFGKNISAMIFYAKRYAWIWLNIEGYRWKQGVNNIFNEDCPRSYDDGVSSDTAHITPNGVSSISRHIKQFIHDFLSHVLAVLLWSYWYREPSVGQICLCRWHSVKWKNLQSAWHRIKTGNLFLLFCRCLWIYAILPKFAVHPELFYMYSSLISLYPWFNLKRARISVTLTNINTLRPGQIYRHFADDIFKCIFFNKNVIWLEISLKFVLQLQIDNIIALVQIKAWCRSGKNPLSESMLVSLVMHICFTRPQWVRPQDTKWEVIYRYIVFAVLIRHTWTHPIIRYS